VSRRAIALAVALVGVLLLVVAAAFAGTQQDPGPSPGGASAPAAAASCTPPPAGDHQITVEDGRAPVLLHVPPGAAKARRGLILVLPGANMTGRSMADYTGYSRLADQRGFLVAYPTASGDRPFWNVSGNLPGKPDDVAYLRAVIRSLTGAAACADARHVGITGVSNGGGMSALMACRAADLLAAAAPVAGGYKALPDCEPTRPLPILEIHGLRDQVVPYNGTTAAHSGAVLPYIAEWRGRNHCTSPAHRSAPASNVVELRWTCAAGRVIVHDRVADAEHGWPGEDSLKPFSSTLRTWRFLSAFRDEAQAGG
jgi:polyhydroxybutyrate depolymerase